MAVADYSKDSLYDSVGLKRMQDSYMKSYEKSPQDRLVSVCNFFGTNEDHSKRLYNYAKNHWLSLSSPLLGYEHSKKCSYPISCYLCFLPDNIEGIISNLSETNYLSVCGGGVSVKIGLRPPGEKSLGAISHIKTYDACVLAYKQGTRRGSYAMYMDIDHPEIMEFIDLRRPTGDYNMRCLNIHHAVNISDKFMSIIEKCCKNSNANDDWPLLDHHSGKIVQIVSAKKIWQRLIETRLQTGEPYICFIDTCNKYMNPFQKKKGFKILQSNLCSEVIVPTNETRSSLCCLASLNVEYYDEWKGNSLFIRDVMEMLDNVLNVFIEKSNNNINLKRIIDSAINEKNIGLGVMGFHSYLQKNNMSIDSNETKIFNKNLFKWLKTTTNSVNLQLGKERGSPNDIFGSGKRFSYTMAIAPTATTSIIMGNTSPSIEPYKANIYRQDTVSGSFYNKNKHLNSLLLSKGFGPKLMEKIWNSIIMNDGSVQKLPETILSDHEKNVFKTFIEIDQQILINLAADRQPYIDQGQSLTLCLDPNIPIKNLHDLHFNAWKQELKTLYYCRSAKVSNADKLSLEDPFSSCTSCQA